MRSLLRGSLLISLTGCAEGCAVTRALYVAVVHRSGAPSRDERVRIDQRETLFLRELPRPRLVILRVAIPVFGAPERRTVVAVHAMVVTARGDMAYRGAWNSHQPLYKEFTPGTLDDVARMVATAITRRSRAVASQAQ